MPQLTQDQTQQYVNLLNQANLHPITYRSLLPTLSGSRSTDDLNNYLSKRTKIDVSKFQAITAPKAEAEAKPQVEAQPEAKVEPIPIAPVTVEPAPAQVLEAETAPEAPANAEPATTTELEAIPVSVPEVTIETAPETPVTVEPMPKIEVAAAPVPEIEVELAKPAPAPEPKVAPKPVVLEFYSCTDSSTQVKNLAPAVVNDGSNLQASIKNCSDWAESNNNTSYIFYKNKCTFAPETIIAAAMCYSSIIPANIPNLPQNAPGIYSCTNNIANTVPFTHFYNNAAGQAQQLRDCSNWMLDGNSSLSINNGACEEFANNQEILAGCLNP